MASTGTRNRCLWILDDRVDGCTRDCSGCLGDGGHITQTQPSERARRRGHARGGGNPSAGTRVRDLQSPLCGDHIPGHKQPGGHHAVEYADGGSGRDQSGVADRDPLAGDYIHCEWNAGHAGRVSAIPAPIEFEGIAGGPVGGMVFQSDGESWTGQLFCPSTGRFRWALPGSNQPRARSRFGNP